MEPLNVDSQKTRCCTTTATTLAPIKSRRKQHLVPREMSRYEQDCTPFTPLDRHVFIFPKLDFGMPEMGKVELERAFTDQLSLHSTNAANETGVDHPNPRELTNDIVTEYQNYRLAAVSWFAKIIPVDMMHTQTHHSVFMPAVNVMDRYVTTCVDLGEDPSQLLKNIANIRAACLSLSIKMHAVFTECDLKGLCEHRDWVNKACVIESSRDTGKPKFNLYILTDEKGIQEAEKQIITKLKGAVFPANGDNMISILCKYLILEHVLGQASLAPSPIDVLNESVILVAAKLFSKRTLDIRLLRFKSWKCIAVCCLLGVIKVCTMDPNEGLRLESSLMSLLEKLKPGEFTQNELCELSEMLTQGCVVCSSSFVNPDVYKALRKISSMSCCKCRKTALVRGKGDDYWTRQTTGKGVPANKVARYSV